MYRGFWGLTIVPGKTYSQNVDMPFRLSNAALDATIKSNTRTSVMLTVDDKSFVLCSLTPGSIEQQTVDITLSEGENITFETTGDNIVHLTGNFVYDMDEDSSEDEDDEDDEDEIDLNDISPEELKEMVEEGLIDPRILMGEGESDEEDLDYDSEDADADDRIREVTDEEEAELVAEVEEEKPSAKEVKIKKQAEKKRKAEQETQKEAASPKKSKQAEKAEKRAQKEAEKKAEKKAEAKPKTKDCGSGVMADIIKEGDGPAAKNGQRVGMYYIGKLTNGKVFDKNTGGKPFWFRLGGGEVIRGWDKGILGMKKGGERRLTIPSNMAYGKRGAPPDIPPNATLVFDIRMVEIK
ncbi:peptidylprolyl isomerase fpr3 [Coemansia sp. RSA 2599]|nr:peptidylprolyl isomerase fpr3 [Coemansia sp. RSA 2598]KAJ1829660.1 peptidylprolyl isomerase fpr3 [Coemansia sp. RSA 2599]